MSMIKNSLRNTTALLLALGLMMETHAALAACKPGEVLMQATDNSTTIGCAPYIESLDQFGSLGAQRFVISTPGLTSVYGIYTQGDILARSISFSTQNGDGSMTDNGYSIQSDGKADFSSVNTQVTNTTKTHTQALVAFDSLVLGAGSGANLIDPIPRVSIDASRKTDGVALPQGNTASRPRANLIGGTIRFNTDTHKFEGFDGTKWVVLVTQ